MRWLIKWIVANPNVDIDQVKKEFIQESKLTQSNQRGLENLLDIPKESENQLGNA